MAVMVLVLTMGLWFVLGVDGVLQPGTFDGKPVLNVCSVVFAALGALAGAGLCALVGKSRGALIAFAALTLIMGTTNAVMHLSKPAPGPRTPGLTVPQAIQQRKEPAWFVLLVPMFGPAAAWLAGRTVPARSAD